MNLRNLLSSYLIFASTVCFCQNKQDYIWHFAKDREPEEGIQSYRFNFNNNFEIEQHVSGLEFDGNNISICDSSGDLLFYTNGCAIANKFDQIMPNGDSLNAGPFFDLLWEGDCGNGYPGAQDITILPDPGNINGYYIIHKRITKEIGVQSYRKELLFSYIDMTLDDGKGDVTIKNEIIYDGEKLLSSYLSPIQHSNKKDWWILQPKRDTNIYLRYLLDDLGLHRKDDIHIGSNFHYNSSAGGTARFSPDGTKYAFYNINDDLLLYDFDRTTGLLSNYQKIIVSEIPDQSLFGSVEWSPNSRFIYTASNLELHQIDLWENDIEEGIELIDEYDGTQNPFSNKLYLMALAPDCKIYMCSRNGNETYHVINNPNEKGLECDFYQNGIQLPYIAGIGSMPNHPRWRVDDDEKCDSSIISNIATNVNLNDISVYPNPSNGMFYFRNLPKAKSRVEVYSSLGEKILTTFKEKSTIQFSIDMSSHESQLYFIKIYPYDKSSFLKFKIMKQ